MVVAAAIAAALFGLPARTWFSQDDDLAKLRNELSEVNAVNSDLDDEVQRLQTDEGIRAAIREELGNIVQGERRESLQDLPLLPRNLPNAWPYSPADADHRPAHRRDAGGGHHDHGGADHHDAGHHDGPCDEHGRRPGAHRCRDHGGRPRRHHDDGRRAGGHHHDRRLSGRSPGTPGVRRVR